MMPFAGGIESTANATLLMSLAAAAIYGFAMETMASWPRTVVKTLGVALLAVLVAVVHGPWLLVAALALGAVGDALLSRDGDRAFLAGLASFLAAHALYIWLFAAHGGGSSVVLAGVGRITIAAILALAAMAMIVLLWPRVKPELRLPILAYCLTIFVMGLAALTLGNPWIIAGALLFIVSDGILGAEKFIVAAISPRRELMRLAVWAFYYCGQLFITLGFLLGR